MKKYIFASIIGILSVIGITWLLVEVFEVLFIGSLAISLFVAVDLCYLSINYWQYISKIPHKIVNLIKYIGFQYGELIKFGLVGAAGSLFNWSFLYVLTEKGHIYYIVSAIISALCTTILNYTINHYWTFRRTKIKNNWFMGWLRYKLIDDMTIAVYIGQLTLFTEIFGIWYIASAILATAINYPIRYLILRKLIWDKKEHSQERASYEWDAFYNGNPIQMWWKHQIANIVWEWMPNSSTLLDIGCGSSPISARYSHITGIDANKDKIEFMREKNPSGDYKVLGDTKSFDDNSFDHVMCLEVIEHLENPIEMISEISRVLKNKGTAVIATPDYSKRLWKTLEAFTPYKEEHHNQFTQVKLDSICQRFNLYPIKYRYIAGCDLVEMFVKEA